MNSAPPLKSRLPGWLPLRHRAEDAAAEMPGLILAAERAAATLFPGGQLQRKAGSGERFWQFRDYTPGDRPQSIDWRQSAKGDRIFVREKEQQLLRTATLWVQAGAGMDYRSRRALPTKRDDAVVLALAIAILLERQGEQVAVLGSDRPPARAPGIVPMVAETLLQPDIAAAIDAAMPARGSSVVLIGDFLDPIERTAGRLRRMAASRAPGLMIQVLDPAERSLPFSGRVIFDEPSGRAHPVSHTVSHVESVRDAYRARIDAHADALRHLARQHGWRFLIHDTALPVREVLARAAIALDRKGGG